MFEYNMRIPYFSANHNFYLRIGNLFAFMMEAGSLHSDSLGFTNDVMVELGYTWMLYRLKFKINKLPKAGDIVTLQTRSTGWDKLRAYRDTDMISESGEILVQSTTVWTVIDIEKMKAVMIPDEIKTYYDSEGERNFSMYENFSKKELDTAGDEIKIYKSDIDYNKHVNAGVYVRWMSDAIHLPDENLKEMEVYYGSQVYFGQNVISKIKKVDEYYYHQILGDGKPSVFAKSLWEE